MIKYQVKDSESALAIIRFIVQATSNGKLFHRRPIVKLEFSEQVSIYHGPKKSSKVIPLYFFKSTAGCSCYALRSNYTRGWSINYLPLEKCTKISVQETDEELVDFEAIAKRFANKIPNGMWPELKKTLLSGEGSKTVQEHQYNIINIRNIFPEVVCRRVQEAITNKTSFSYTVYGKARDRSVAVEPDKTGEFVRAWYSSEYSGCGNGCYYILLNDHEATLGEYD